LLIRRSKASPEAAWVIWASVKAGGDETKSTFDTTNTGSVNTSCQSCLAHRMIKGISKAGVMIILETIAIITVLFSPGLESLPDDRPLPFEVLVSASMLRILFANDTVESLCVLSRRRFSSSSEGGV